MVDGDTDSIADLLQSPGASGLISLREALIAANNTPTGPSDPDHEIFFDPNVSNKTITLTQGVLSILENITISPDQSTQWTIDAVGNSNIFHIDGEFEQIDVTIERLQLINGTNDTVGILDQGGGIYTRNATLNLDSVILRNNHSDTGGGLFVDPTDGDEITISNSLIEDNTTNDGGAGIAVRGELTADVKLTIRKSTIRGNQASGFGGGLLFEPDGGALTVERSLIEGNTAISKGGGLKIGGGFGNSFGHNMIVRIEGTTIRNNSVNKNGASGDGSGGGVSFEADNSSLTIAAFEQSHMLIPTIVEENTAHGSTLLKLPSFPTPFTQRKAGGGGLFLNSNNSTFSLTDVVVRNNRTTLNNMDVNEDVNEDGDGGGIVANVFGNGQVAIDVERMQVVGNSSEGDAGGALFVTVRSDMNITDSTFDDNESVGDGGGLYGFVAADAGPSLLTIRRSTFSNNSSDRNGGGALLCAKIDGDIQVMNSTFSGNTGLLSGGGIAFAVSDVNESLDARMANVTVTENHSAQGGGIFIDSNLNSEMIEIEMHNSIVAANTNQTTGGQPSDIDVEDPQEDNLVPASSHNLIGSGGSGGLVHGVNGNIVGEDDPELAPLGDYGGLSKTHVPLPTSPVLDKGSNARAVVPFASQALLFDQRQEEDLVTTSGHFDRRIAFTGATDIVDIGATELSPFVKVVDVEILSTVVVPYDIPARSDSGEQIRTVPQGKSSHGITVRFNRAVDIQTSDLTLTGEFETVTSSQTIVTNYTTQSVVNCAACDGAPTYTASWIFSSIPQYSAEGVPNGSASTFGFGRMELVLSGITFGSQSLDGNWSNPNCVCDGGDTFPSGNDVELAGESFTFDFTFLPADFDRDNKVTFSDYLLMSANFGTLMTEAAFADGDANLDKLVSFPDFLVLSSEFGIDLNNPGCCSGSALSGGGNESETSGSNRRLSELAQFNQLRDDGASKEILAMGLHLLELTWKQTGASREDWLAVEDDLLSEIIGLEKASQGLEAELLKLRSESKGT